MSREAPAYYCIRKADGMYLRGARFWRWTRFKRFASRIRHQEAFNNYMARYQPGVEYTIVSATGETR